MKSANRQSSENSGVGQSSVTAKHLFSSKDARHPQNSSNHDARIANTVVEPPAKPRNALRPSIQLRSFEDDDSDDSEEERYVQKHTLP